MGFKVNLGTHNSRKVFQRFKMIFDVGVRKHLKIHGFEMSFPRALIGNKLIGFHKGTPNGILIIVSMYLNYLAN